jgi:hypothetical protein
MRDSALSTLRGVFNGRLMNTVKAARDPLNLMNPGTLPGMEASS